MTFTTEFANIEAFFPKDINLEALHIIEHGGVASATGFKAAGVAAGFRPKDPTRLDVALVTSDIPAFCAGVFTQNTFSAAPVEISRVHVQEGRARAFFVNSGCANAATGAQGKENAEAMARIAAEELGLSPTDILIASTGVIGQHLNMDAIKRGARNCVAQLQHSTAASHDAACAIMTTDTHPKEFAISWKSRDERFNGATFTLGGMAKGSGMIMPNMATMIAALTTDAPLSKQTCDALLKEAVDVSFNKVTVDGDTSTNDTCVLIANGAATDSAHAGSIQPGDVAYDEVRTALYAVTTTLAKSMAADGEGATKLVTVHVTQAASEHDADLVARTIANSALVKTAIYGNDANWGRIAGAIGRTGLDLHAETIDITFMGVAVLQAGLPIPFDEAHMLELFKQDEIRIDVSLGQGTYQTTMWTCDLTTDYIHINADYRS